MCEESVQEDRDERAVEASDEKVVFKDKRGNGQRKAPDEAGMAWEPTDELERVDRLQGVELWEGRPEILRVWERQKDMRRPDDRDKREMEIGRRRGGEGGKGNRTGDARAGKRVKIIQGCATEEKGAGQ